MTNSNQKERFRTRIAMQEQNITVLQNKCEEYLAEQNRTRKALDVAVNALNNIATIREWAGLYSEQEIAQETLDQIKQIMENKGE